jgi:hypothetical protein
MAVARNATIQFQGGAIKICYFDSMKLVTAFLLSLVLVIISACDCSRKTWDCPGFDSPELSGWFPYGNTGLLVYQNNTGQRDSVHLNNLETTTPYTTTGTSRYCSAQRHLESTEKMPNGDLKMAVRLTKSENSGNFTNSGLITLHNYMAVEFQNVTATTLGTARFNYSTPMTIQYFSTLNIGSRTFNDAAVASRDTVSDKSAGIYKLYIAKNQGVVGYEELPSRSLYVLQ